jgi:hypothetical protein
MHQQQQRLKVLLHWPVMVLFHSLSEAALQGVGC